VSAIAGKWPPDWWHHVSSAVLYRCAWVGAVSMPDPRRTGERLRVHPLRCACFWSLAASVLLVAASWLANPTIAAADAEADERVTEGTVTGEIVTATKHAISVEFARTATATEEMLLPLDAKVKVEGPKKLADLRPGDRVRVQYRQTYREGKNGERITLKTLATKIVLLRTAAPEGSLRSNETATP